MLDLVDQGTNVRQQLNGKVVTSLDEFLGFLSRANTGRGTSQDDGTSGQSSALGEEADELGDVEDEVTVSGSWLACACGVASIYQWEMEIHVRKRAVLHDTAALETTDVKLGRIGDQSSGDQNGTYDTRIS